MLKVRFWDKPKDADGSSGWIYYRKRRGSSGMLAGALLKTHALLEPGQKHVLEATRAEAPESVEDGDRPQPGAPPVRGWAGVGRRLMGRKRVRCSSGSTPFRSRGEKKT